jgi:hypothetical protein
MRTGIIITIIILVVIVIAIPIFFFFGSNKEAEFFPTKEEMNSIGLPLWDKHYEGYKITTESYSGGLFLFNKETKIQYTIYQETDSKLGYATRFLFIKIYSFDSPSNKDEHYRRWSSGTDVEEMTGGNIIGDKSYFRDYFDEFHFVFVKGDYLVKIQAEDDLDKEQVRTVAQLVEQKISVN